MKWSMIVAFVVFSLVADVVVFRILLRRAKNSGRNDPNWLDLARQLGLTLTGGDPVFPAIRWLAFLVRPVELVGTWREWPIRIYGYNQGSGKSSIAHLAVDLTGPNPKGLQLYLGRKGRWISGRPKPGPYTAALQAVQTGDETMDAKVNVWASDPVFLRTALLPEIKTRLVHLLESGSGAEIRLEGATLIYDEVGGMGPAAKARIPEAVETLGAWRGIVAFYNR